MNQILVACVGNIFNSDDGFGVEVARKLASRNMASNVVVEDFGIRGRDFAFALLENWSVVIIVDAVRRGENPGTLFIIKPTADDFETDSRVSYDAHSLDPLSVLRLAHQMGARLKKIRVVGCEPATVEEGFGLSDAVSAAVPCAIELIDKMVNEIP